MNNSLIGSNYCPFCRKVKNYFDSNKIQYAWIDIETAEGQRKRS